MRERLGGAGRRFARIATRAVVARPALWRLFRRPLRAQFDWLAPQWEARRSTADLASVEAALDRLALHPRRVLDVGTGTGLAARLLARRYPKAEVLGVDVSPGMLAEARRLLPDESSGRVSFREADAAALPFGGEEFELVVLLNMIPFFDELARVTAPGGALLVAFGSGPATPIYVPPDTLRHRLAPLGFERFEEIAAGEATALVARKA